MSEPLLPRGARTADRGFTLPELLLSVAVIGIIFAAISGAIVTVLRQHQATTGRVVVASAEQSISLWVPADLASAAWVTTDPAAMPCDDDCPPEIGLHTGSNALLLTWSVELPGGGTREVRVGYVFLPTQTNEDDAAINQTFELVRVVCTSSGGGWTCTSNTVLSDQPGPPGGETFVAGVTRPSWVIMVSEPLAADATNSDQVAAPDDRFRDARRVIVTVNGGGPSAGAGGGTNQISITAGGTRRSEIPASSLQGVPSFVEARSRCGGSMVLVVDESNSITNTYIGQVRNAVAGFIETLAGTPVQLQVVRFHTRSSILGDSAAWTRYYDLSSQSEVDALLAAVPNLQGSWSSSSERNGGTNWEDALFRAFYEPTGQLQQNLPDTVVFFTDGVPTYGRLDDPLYPATVTRGAPGALPAEPAPPTAGWPLASGTAYNQVSFNRANYIATRFRSSVKLIGVGVGPDITAHSQWMADPGAGYHLAWERGSRTYQRAGSWTNESQWQVRNYWWSSWYNTSQQVYQSETSTNRRLAWGPISATIFNANNTTADSTDGYRRISLGNFAWVSTAEYQAAQSTLNADLYVVRAKEWATGPDWEPWTGTRDGTSSHYRSTKVYAPPFEAFDTPSTSNVRNDVILARLIAGNDTGVPAQWNGSAYVNAEVADMYVSPNWSQLAKALQAVALGECGGTLTVQTRVDGTTPAVDPFTYQNSTVVDSSGSPMLVEPTVVRTNQQFTSGTFDFQIPNGQFVDVEILPLNLSDLGGYSPQGWSCRAGLIGRPVQPVPVAGTPWSGIRVRVAANEAVSCTLAVAKQ